MKNTIALAWISILSACGGSAEVGVDSDELMRAPVCSTAQIQELLQPASAAHPAVHLKCRTTLSSASHRITKRVLFSGDRSNGAMLDCAGSTIGSGGNGLVVVTSQRSPDGNWVPVRDVVVRRCNISGRIVIKGMNAADELIESRKPGFTAVAQAKSPRNIVLDRLHITVTQDSAIYVAAGTNILLRRSILDGRSSASAIYLNQETARNRIIGNTIAVQQTSSWRGREQIAIDGSAGNWIANNYFGQLNTGGIFLYRNCGETAPNNPAGTIRHQHPRRNFIVNNYFYYGRYRGSTPAVWLGSRAGNRNYCNEDNGYPFGSSRSNLDYAVHNVVAHNQFAVRNPAEMIKVSAAPNAALNVVTDNRTVPSRINRPAGCVVDHGTSLSYVSPGTVVAGKTCNEGIIVKPPVPLPLRRYFLPGVGHTASTSPTTPKYNGTLYNAEGRLGYLLSHPHTQGRYAPFYVCVNQHDSTDYYYTNSFECEYVGSPIRMLGYYPVSLPAGSPNTALVYRCYLPGDHFLSRHASCEVGLRPEQQRRVFTSPPPLPW